MPHIHTTPSKASTVADRVKSATRSSRVPSVRPAKLLVQRAALSQDNDNLLKQLSVTGAPSTSNQREIVYEYTDFFDASLTKEKPVIAVGGDPAPNLFQSDGTVGESGNTLGRVESVTAWVLPRADPGKNAASTFIACTAVKALVQRESGSESKLVNVQNTVVQPDFNIKWRKVLHYTAKQLFSDNYVLPTTSVQGDVELFRITIVDPDNGAVDITNKYQVMYTVRMSAVIPPNTSRKVLVEPVANWDADTVTGTSFGFVLSDVVRVRNAT